MQVEALQPFGARIHELDISRPLTRDQIAAVFAAFNEHAVLVFPQQQLDDDLQTAFSAQFGALEASLTQLRLQQRIRNLRPEISDLSNIDEQGRILPLDHLGNMLWHSDSSYKPVPALASILSAREVPPTGGETEFADLRAAWDALPQERRAGIDKMVAEHSLVYSRKQIGYEFNAQEAASLGFANQALVRTLHVSGRRTLYLSSHASHILGMPVDAGRALLQELLEFATQPKFVYRHRWKSGDVVMWDNRCTLHRLRPWEMDRYKRVMRRTTLAGVNPTVVNGVPATAG